MMLKKKTPKRPRAPRKALVDREKIAATIAELDKIEPSNAKVAKAITLFKTWLADESGYDEEVWPRLKKALEEDRKRAGARSLFHD